MARVEGPESSGLDHGSIGSRVQHRADAGPGPVVSTTTSHPSPYGCSFTSSGRSSINGFRSTIVPRYGAVDVGHRLGRLDLAERLVRLDGRAHLGQVDVDDVAKGVLREVGDADAGVGALEPAPIRARRCIEDPPGTPREPLLIRVARRRARYRRQGASWRRSQGCAGVSRVRERRDVVLDDADREAHPTDRGRRGAQRQIERAPRDRRAPRPSARRWRPCRSSARRAGRAVRDST